jgi:hypothetical protein
MKQTANRSSEKKREDGGEVPEDFDRMMDFLMEEMARALAEERALSDEDDDEDGGDEEGIGSFTTRLFSAISGEDGWNPLWRIQAIEITSDRKSAMVLRAMLRLGVAMARTRWRSANRTFNGGGLRYDWKSLGLQ